MMNNPVNLNDPTGHYANPCAGAASGYKCHRALDKGRAEERTKRAHAEKLSEMLMFALLGYDEIDLTGDAIELIKNDPGFKDFQAGLSLIAMNNPKFGKSYFNFFVDTKKDGGILFGGQRSLGDMFSQLPLALVDPDNPKLSDTWAAAKNPLTWMLRHADVSARVDVYEDKQVLFSYSLSDTLNLEPQEGRDDYNKIVGVLGPIWRDGLGASEPKVYANWSVLINLNINLTTAR